MTGLGDYKLTLRFLIFVGTIRWGSSRSCEFVVWIFRLVIFFTGQQSQAFTGLFCRWRIAIFVDDTMQESDGFIVGFKLEVEVA